MKGSSGTPLSFGFSNRLAARVLGSEFTRELAGRHSGQLFEVQLLLFDDFCVADFQAV